MSDKAHRTNEGGQLKPLKDRLDENALRRRQEKNEYRRTVSQEHAKTRGALNLLARAVNTEAHRQRKWNLALAGAAILNAILAWVL